MNLFSTDGFETPCSPDCFRGTRNSWGLIDGSKYPIPQDLVTDKIEIIFVKNQLKNLQSRKHHQTLGTFCYIFGATPAFSFENLEPVLFIMDANFLCKNMVI